MASYELFVESGPQKKTTLVHVLALLGCVVAGKTTDEAVHAAPDAIRAYLRYLKRHGAKVDPDERIETRIAEHNTEGLFSGQSIWPPDLKPLAPADLSRDLRWLAWSRADLLALVDGIDDRRLRAKPAKGRSLHEILLHVLEADKSYVYGLVGPLKVPQARDPRSNLPVGKIGRGRPAEPRDGGADRVRTGDLRLARAALSQLSYSPEVVRFLVGGPKWI